MKLPATSAPDGTPVAPYLMLPARDEALLIHRALVPTTAILELGCGTGRVARELADLDHPVVAIDQSSEMLQHVAARTGITHILADIETLSLERAFGGVVLASYLVNTADPDRRARFLATCRRHVAEDGAVVIQRIDPETCWISGTSSFYGPVRVRLVEASQDACVVHLRLEYEIGNQVFPQVVVAEVLEDEALHAALAKAELAFDRWLDEQETWLVARPALR